MIAREASLRSATWVFKYWFGLSSCFSGIFLFNHQHPYGSGLIAFPFILAGLFFLGVARVEVGHDEVRYRRWFRWRAIPYSEIVDCGESWVYGYITLRRFVFPWRSLYFVRPYASDSLFGWDKTIISKIRSEAHL